MLKLRKNSYRQSIFLIACPAGFLMSGSGIQKGCKKDFDKYQYTKKVCFSISHREARYRFEKISPLGNHRLSVCFFQVIKFYDGILTRIIQGKNKRGKKDIRSQKKIKRSQNITIKLKKNG